MKNNIVIDYRKCISIIDSCTNSKQLISCGNLINNFSRKHKLKQDAHKRWNELYDYWNLKLKTI